MIYFPNKVKKSMVLLYHFGYSFVLSIGCFIDLAVLPGSVCQHELWLTSPSRSGIFDFCPNFELDLVSPPYTSRSQGLNIF